MRLKWFTWLLVLGCALQAYASVTFIAQFAVGDKNVATFSEDGLYAVDFGAIKKALAQSRFADEVMIAGGETGRSDRHYTLVDMGTIQSLLGNFDAAEDLLRQAAALDEELLDPKCTAAIETKEAIADNCLRRGDRETARQLYSDLELELEKDFGPDYDKVVELRDKRTAIQ